MVILISNIWVLEGSLACHLMEQVWSHFGELLHQKHLFFVEPTSLLSKALKLGLHPTVSSQGA